MRSNKRQSFQPRRIAPGIAILAALLACALLLGGCGKEIAGAADCFSPVETITPAGDARIIALGEAAHGNVEFQELKLSVFQTLVATTNLRAFALEGDFGGCARVNDYILGGAGTAEEAVAAIGFQIYRTRQMVELVSWMREYNASAEEADQVRFYGFDMQRTENSLKGLLTCYAALEPVKGAALAARLDPLYGEERVGNTEEINALRDAGLADALTDLAENQDAYVAAAGAETYAYAVQYAKCLTQGQALACATGDYNTLRDAYMAENVGWILETEALHGRDMAFLSGHNGHVAKEGGAYTNMGSLLKAQYGDAYFVVGTDYWKTLCNIAGDDKRGNHRFASGDPLAAQLRGAGKNVLYLDFYAAQAVPEVDAILHSSMKMGSLGEWYAWYMHLLPMSHRITAVPTALYDGMIFVYQATPTQVLPMGEE